MMFALIFFYFAFHAFHGERGLLAYIRNSHQLSEAKEELARATAEREVLEKRVRGLRSGSLDLDLLDERARDMLGLVRPNEILVVWPQDEKNYE